MNNGLTMKRTASLILGLTLTAPVFAINMPEPAPVKSIEVVPGTTVRFGPGINTAYRVTTMAGLSSEVWMYTDCRTDDKTLLFINAQANKSLRVYAMSSISRYTPGTAFEPDADSPFMTTRGLDLCKQNVPEAKWAGVPSTIQNGEKQFVDVSHSQREGAVLKARLATDFDKIYHEEKYGAPYSVKIEDVVFNCEKAEGMTARTFSLDNQGMVTDTSAGENKALTPEATSVAKTLCGASDLSSYKGIGTLVLRDKEVADTTPAKPDLDNNTPAALQRFALPGQVTKAIDKIFIDPQQKPAFRSISFTQGSPEGDGLTLRAKVDVQPDGTTLTVTKMSIGNADFYSQYQRLFNMVDVKKWETMSEAPWVSKNLESNFTLPLQPGKTYSSRSLVSNKDKPDTEQTLSQVCVAGKEWQNAADIHPNFPGRYLELICKQDLGDGKEASGDYAYFEDLRMFIRFGYQEKGEAKRFIYSDVKVVR